MNQQTATQIAITDAIARLIALRDCPAAKMDIDYDNADHLFLLRDLSFAVAGLADPIFAAIAQAGNIASKAPYAAKYSYAHDVFDMVHDDLASELTCAARQAEDRLDEGAEYERDDYAEHNTLFAAAQL